VSVEDGDARSSFVLVFFILVWGSSWLQARVVAELDVGTVLVGRDVVTRAGGWMRVLELLPGKDAFTCGRWAQNVWRWLELDICG